MYNAVRFMIWGNGREGVRHSSRLYEAMKVKFSRKMVGHRGYMKGKKMSDDARRKISKALKGRKGHVAWNKGKHHSEETKQKLREKTIEQFNSDEKRERHRKSCVEKWNDTEYRNKVSSTIKKQMKDPERRKKCSHKPTQRFYDAMKKRRGSKSPMAGKHHSEESKQKNREKHLGRTPWNKGLKRCTNGVSILYKKDLPEGFQWVSQKRKKNNDNLLEKEID